MFRLFLLGLLACGPDPIAVRDQTVTAACGMCQLNLPDTRGCYWAVEIDGKAYPVTGPTPKDHKNHAPDGMCNVKREAVVDGEIRGATFVARRFELKGLLEAVPENPRYTEADIH